MKRILSFLAAGAAVSALALAPLAFAQINPGRSAPATTLLGQPNTWTALQTFNASLQVPVTQNTGIQRGPVGWLIWNDDTNRNLLIGATGQTMNTGGGMTGQNNIGIGATPLGGVTTGASNIAIGGAGTLGPITTGANNVCIGNNCGTLLEPTSNANVLLGTNAGPTVSNTFIQNAVCIGQGCVPASNQVILGNGSTTITNLKGQVNAPSLTIGAGTVISASFRGTVTWAPSILAGSCATNTVSLAGAVAGADCIVTPPSVISTPFILIPVCWVTLNTCNIQACNPTAGTENVTSGTWACRVLNP